MSGIAESISATVDRLRREVCDLHAELTRYGLVVWTAGNVSARVPGAELMVIKPSGVSYDDLTPENMVLCDLSGVVVEGDLTPSSDTASHAYVYRHRPDVGGVVHTHSPYATAWAGRGEETTQPSTVEAGGRTEGSVSGSAGPRRSEDLA